MTMYISSRDSMVSFACGGLIGFFIWLTALGYRRIQVARFCLVWNSNKCTLLAVFSGWLAFG